MDGIRVEVMSAPGPGADGKVLRHPDASTAAHTALLRGLVDWAAALDTRVRELDVMEQTEDGAGLWALVRVHERDLEAVLAEHAVMRVPPPHGWSGYRAEGVLPTGHRPPADDQHLTPPPHGEGGPPRVPRDRRRRPRHLSALLDTLARTDPTPPPLPAARQELADALAGQDPDADTWLVPAEVL